MSELKEIKMLVAIEPPTKRSEVFGVMFCWMPGTTTFNKPWHMQKQIDTAVEMITAAEPLTKKQVNGMTCLSVMEDEEYSNCMFKIVTTKAWVSD